MVKQAIAEMEKQMKKSIERFKAELASMRTGRASVALLDGVKVEYYGSKLALNQVGNLSVPDSRTIEIKPWDTNALPEIEKAILKSNLGVTPNNDGKLIRINLPKLSEERRKELAKNIKKIAENYRISVRGFRRDAIELIKKDEKEKTISKDMEQSAEQEVQKITNAYVHQIEEILVHKEKEIMEI